MRDDTVTLGPDQAWSCEHRSAHGSPAPARRITPDDWREETPRIRSVDRPRCVICPDCGTYWRVWKTANVARPYLEPPARSHELLRAPERDVDVITALVCAEVPNAAVSQLRQSLPDDDDAVWLFELPDEPRTVQIDGVGRYGQCPFVLEHSGMAQVTDRRELDDPRAVARAVITYLAGLNAGR